ncbi:zinc finger, C2H2 type [Necator americanus]|uniref:Zinc finger, C2H2 type n=1 Tax=Necator americanus TaxID=51031 RepID=W2SJR9_NECAM|nr:zinc finger, C2H2 type [Necator americanus]ETN69002.1 zinc finger, C2H2 type [Necator americanus]
MRSKMIRCKRCKNRFIERNIYERHLRDKHPEDYTIYIQEQEAEMEQQRQEEIEANRIEELQTGGFIPPESEIEASSFDVDVEGIPLPGENNGGVAPRFDQYGRLKQLKRPYKKKISPQCPFCDKRFRNEYSLKKHFVKKHSELVEFKQCTRCYKCVKDGEEMENHLCELVMTHERIHTGMIKFECRICDYKANRFVQMDEHCKNEHGYICSICQEKTAEWSDMKHHTLVKHGGYLATEQSAGEDFNMSLN